MLSQDANYQQISLPAQIGLIVLEDCFHFPGCYLPLYIFEQRYREMLDHALNGTRMFAVGTKVDGKLLPVTTAGLIRASKKRPDGTSHVMLYGVSRVRFTGWVQENPFRIATIEPLETKIESTPAGLKALKDRAISLLPPVSDECGEAMHKLRELLASIDNPEIACDILSYHFVRDSAAAVTILMEKSLERRYETLFEALSELNSIS
ncbi:MAG: LON peptidase substrate-binding domain-containing protein [Prosthecobacter sp.]|jgi:ATP-dependent Lon protease|nr:LON peptidase substrate-binding domain-containing protein [Prosthecobacter sp.]